MNIAHEDQACNTCGEYKHRAVTVDAVIVKDNNFLVIRRKNEPAQGMWALPGGHVDWNESAEDAVLREIREETGLIASQPRLIGVYSTPERDPKQKITAAFFVHGKGTLKAGDDAQDAQWISFTDADTFTLAFDHSTIVNDYLKLRAA